MVTYSQILEDPSRCCLPADHVLDEKALRKYWLSLTLHPLAPSADAVRRATRATVPAKRQRSDLKKIEDNTDGAKVEDNRDGIEPAPSTDPVRRANKATVPAKRREAVDLEISELGRSSSNTRKTPSAGKVQKTDKKVFGTKRQVWAGVAQKTQRGLTKKDLMISSSGKIVSKRQHQAGKRLFQKWGEPWKLACLKVCAMRGLPLRTHIVKGTEEYNEAMRLVRFP